jgi:phenylacetate-CoA ligase
LADLPYTFKSELISDEAHHGFAKNLTWPIERYSRLHRTSGTKGRPLTVLDTPRDWEWWIETWQPVLDVAELQPKDRVMMAFSFGPFIGFWSAFEAAIERGCLVAPAGAMKSLARLELIRDIGATVVFCTPSYALHLAEVADSHHYNLRQMHVRALIVAGEPGGSIPEVRQQIEQAWGAKVIDHAGASEVGPWGFADPAGRGIYVNEAELIPEFISLETGEPANEDELSELVLTSLGRSGNPVIRYRTGDLVRPTWSDDQECRYVLLAGGVLGRTDDMLIIRGVNIYPGAIERILRSFPEIIEYRMIVYQEAALDQLKIEIEDRLNHPQRVEEELQVRIGLRVEVQTVPIGSLPRFEGKGKRLVRV